MIFKVKFGCEKCTFISEKSIRNTYIINWTCSISYDCYINDLNYQSISCRVKSFRLLRSIQLFYAMLMSKSKLHLDYLLSWQYHLPLKFLIYVDHTDFKFYNMSVSSFKISISFLIFSPFVCVDLWMEYECR